MTFGITRRDALFGLSSLSVLVAGDAGAVPDSVLTAARTEGTLTWYVAQVEGAKAEMLGKAFTAAHPGITVSVIRTTGQVAYQRLLLDIKNRTPQCDVFSTTDISHMPVLKGRKELAEYIPDNAAAMVPAFKTRSDPGYFYITNASRYLLLYNSARVKPEDAPKAWTDLLDPKWKGKVAMGHPAFSGCMGTWTLSLKKLYGWRFFEDLAKNNPRIGRSAADPITLMSAGECLVGPSSVAGAYLAIDRGNPLAVVHPSDGLVLCVTPSAIPINAPHPNAARVFLDWMLSEQYSNLLAGDGAEPIREGVPTRPGVPLIATQKVIPMTTEELRTGVPEVIEQWRETFGN